VVDCLPFPLLTFAYEHLVPKLFEQMRQGAEPVKIEAGSLLSQFIYAIPCSLKRKAAIDKLVNEFAYSKTSFLKKQYVDFCALALT